MNICVYGSADELDEKCLNAAKALGNYIGKNGHTLVFGGFGDGLLGTVADGLGKRCQSHIRITRGTAKRTFRVFEFCAGVPRW